MSKIPEAKKPVKYHRARPEHNRRDTEFIENQNISDNDKFKK
jgi:hypothetical protein